LARAPDPVTVAAKVQAEPELPDPLRSSLPNAHWPSVRTSPFALIAVFRFAAGRTGLASMKTFDMVQIEEV
jgi:hypothetical protein